jgi:hypothetical protein
MTKLLIALVLVAIAGCREEPEARTRAAEVYVPADEIDIRSNEITMPPLEIIVTPKN